jgi:bacteriorhodopsin
MELLAAMVIMLLVAAAVLPAWPYAKWGYYPSGACGALVLALVGLILTGHF